MDPYGTAFNYQIADIPRDATIITSNSTWVLKDGQQANIHNGLFSHHLLVIDMSKRTPTVASCPNGKPVQEQYSVISGSAEDKGGAFYSTSDGEFNSGYYIGKDDKVILQGDVVNYNNETQEVYHLFDIQYIEGRPPGSMEAVTQLWDLGFCSGAIDAVIHPPPGVKRFSFESQTMKIEQNGYFLGFRKYFICHIRL
jgi:hypothetical protein